MSEPRATPSLKSNGSGPQGHGSEAACHFPRSRSRGFRFWTWSHRATAALFFGTIMLGHLGWLSWLSGSPTAANWFGVLPLLDPLAALEAWLASGLVTTTMLLGLVGTAGVAVVLGRVFCGWICPLGLLLELNASLRQRAVRWLRRVGIRLPQKKLPLQLKYWILLACVVLSFVAALPVFTSLSPINWSILGLASFPGVAILVLFFWMVLELLFPRAFCRSICPLGALYSLLGRFASLRVRVVSTKRIACHQCTLHCPMGIDVMESYVLAEKTSIDDPECTRCGVCTDVCQGNVLRLRFQDASLQNSPCGTIEN